MIIKHQHYDLLDKIVLERVIFNPPLKLDRTMHNEACFLFGVNGQSIMYSAIDKVTFQNSEGLLMKCGNYLNTVGPTKEEKPYDAIAIHFYPDVLKLVYEDSLPSFLQEKPGAKVRSIKRVKADEMLNNYIQSLIHYFENPELITEELIILKVKELILLLTKLDPSNEVHDILKELFNPTVYSFKEIINAHLFHELSLKDLARLSNLSLSSFKRRFKDLFQESPATYIKGQRLEHGAKLLKMTSKSVSEIAYECCFSDVSHFSKSFRLAFGQSPSAFREAELDRSA